jgi:hypothetical protein
VLKRLVDVENPRVTHYLIDWDAPNEQLVPPPAASEEIPDDDIINDDDEDEEDEDEDDDEEGGDVQMDMDEEIPGKTTGGIAETTNLSMTHE